MVALVVLSGVTVGCLLLFWRLLWLCDLLRAGWDTHYVADAEPPAPVTAFAFPAGWDTAQDTDVLGEWDEGRLSEETL